MEHNNPFFSVIIPTYNRSHVIAKAVNSVLRQQFENWELIIIDDGSKDNTAKVLQQFNDSRIKYHYQENTERSQARNNGIAMSKGFYICFLDSDDEYCPNHLAEFHQFIVGKNFPEALIFSNPIVIEEGKETPIEVEVFSGHNSLDYILKNSIIPDRVCIHKMIFEKYLFNPKVNIGEDTILWAQITNTYLMLHLNAYTVKYLVHDDNSVNLKNNVYKSRLDGLNALFREEAIEKRLSPNLKKQTISVCYYGIARYFEGKQHFFRMTFNALLSILYDLKSPQNKAKLYMIYNYLKTRL